MTVVAVAFDQWAVRAFAFLVACGGLWRYIGRPVMGWTRTVREKLEAIDKGVAELAIVDSQVDELARIRDQITEGLRGMARIVASDEDRVALVEAELRDNGDWQKAHKATHDELERRVRDLERERKSA